MRTILIASLAVLSACSGPAPPPAPAAPQAPAAAATDAEPVISAERSQAAEARRIGWVEASEKWAAPDAIVLQDGPSSARDFLAGIDPGNRGDTSLQWAPEFAGIAASGDLGFTSGPFNGDGAAFGYYLTVWRRQPDGSWRWIYNGGVDTPDATKVADNFDVVVAKPSGAGEGSAGAAITAVGAIEAQMRADATPAQLGRNFAAISRLHRQDRPPTIGPGAIMSALAGGPSAVDYAQLRAEASTAGDMVFTLGEARWNGGSGYYARIWSREAEGWRIVFDQIVLRDLRPL